MNLEDIAKLAGVSRSTVSRVINNDPRVSDRARARVQKVIAEQNFHPNAAARSLATRRSQVVGLLIPAFASSIFYDPWFPVMIQGCMDSCQELDLSLMLLMESETDADAARRLIQRTVRGRHLDGVVIANSMVDTGSTQDLAAERFPYVVIGRTEDDATSWVDIDNEEAAHAATRHLIDHDRRRIAMLAGPTSLVSAHDRIAGYRRAMEEVGLEPLIRHADYDQRVAFDTTLELLRCDDAPDAIFAASDEMAVGTFQAARQAGKQVPEDLAIMGFDDLHPVRMAALGVSSVRQPARELGHRAIELLNALITNPSSGPYHEVHPTELIYRTSCGCPAPSEPMQPGPARSDSDGEPESIAAG